MDKVQVVRNEIYGHFQASEICQRYFFEAENRDIYAAYYTSMYLIQDTSEAVWCHMARDFSADSMLAYIEFWGVMQAVIIQQDAIKEIYRVVFDKSLEIEEPSAWARIRDTRNLCVGHPANRAKRKGPVERTFMGRKFGSYDHIKYESFDSRTKLTRHLTFNLR